jgi:O-antigen/teichoic acid export membrane protein
MNLLHGLARNVSIVAMSQLAMWLATLMFTIAQAHLLGPARFGQLSLALSYAMFLTVVIDFGLGIQLSRMIAQRSGGADALAATIIVRCALWVAAVPCLWLATAILGYEPELQGAILVLALSILFVGISTTIESYLRGQERFLLPSIAGVAYRLVAAAVGVMLLLLGHDLVTVAGAFLLGAIAYLVVLLAGLRAWPVTSRVDTGLAVKLFRTAIPLGLWWIIGTFGFNVDIVIVERLLPAENVGWYAAALRLFTVATIIPGLVVGMVLSPVLSRLSLGPQDELRALLQKALAVLVLFGAVISLTMALFADHIIAVLYPAEAYASAASALRLLAPRVLFLYVNSVLMYTLVALHQEKRLLLMVATLAILNPLANLVAVPLLKQDGAALVSSLTEFAWLIWLASAMPRDLLSPDRPLRVARPAEVA